MLTRLTLVLTMTAQPPSMQAAQDAFNDGDYANALETYRKLAQTPGTPLPVVRAGEHNSLVELHRVTGEAAHMCDAQALARGVLAGDLLRSDDERRVWQARAADDAAKLAAVSAAAGRDVCAPDEPPPAPGVRERPPARTRIEPPRTEPTRAEGPAPSSPVRPPPTRRPMVRRVGAGLLIASGGLLVGAFSLLAGRARVDASIRDVNGALWAMGREATPAERAQVDAADRRYVDMSRAALALGLTAAAATMTGAVLMALPGRHRAIRSGVRPAGIVFAF